MALARSAKDADANIVYIAYDLEATGLDTNTDSIVEFSASVLIPPGEHSAAFSASRLYCINSRVKPTSVGWHMNAAASEVTGIKDSDLKASPCFGDVWAQCFVPMVKRYVCDWKSEHGLAEDKRVPIVLRLVGHNSRRFDDMLLLTELQRAFPGQLPRNLIRAQFGEQIKFTFCDTMIAASLAWPACNRPMRDLKLGTLYAWHTGTELRDAHSAFADCIAVAQLLNCEQLVKYLVFSVTSLSQLTDKHSLATACAREKKRKR